MKEEFENTACYNDMLDLPHHVSMTHPRMSIQERAAQFSPFAALTGYGDVVRETARLTDDFMDLDENSREGLDRRLALLQEHLHEGPEVTVSCFQPDERKSGGAYRSVTGIVKKIDTYGRFLVMTDGKKIPVEYIIQIDGELFGSIGEE